MLAALSIRDIVLIDRLDIAFDRGLTVLTGETGAGKSILLDALTLALGGRGDGAMVRQGAAQGHVIAAFDLAADHPARAILRDNAIDESDEVILKRVQGADGRSRAFINDQPVSVGLLKTVGGMVVEIHGQHDERALVAPAAHRDLLDAFGGLGGQADAVGAAHRALRQAEADFARLTEQIAAARAEADYLRASVEELEQLAPREGEEEALATRRQTMRQAEKIAGELEEGRETVSGSASPIPILASLVRRLERRKDEAAELLEPVIAALDRALADLDEAASALEAATRASQYDPGELERSEERLFALRGLARKHNVAPDGLPALLVRFRDGLADLDSGEERLAALGEAVAAARRAYDAAAAALSKARGKAARKLEAAVGLELPALKLEHAAFMVEIETDPQSGGESGIDRVGFVVRTNPGSAPGPLMKVASGGELSRFLLALKVALADRGSAPTLIFDEVDTAVGGQVSDAIGQRLARLAERVQVISVTHAPQVAARASAHLRVAKEVAGKTTATQLAVLDPAERREEIARMLAGSVITDEARAAADQLIVGA
jgi:DNA repair protein RecN (Recombination protein N)